MPRGEKRKRAEPRPAKPAGKKPSFPLFGRLPVEIQQQIFGEAIRTPNFHTVKVGRVDDAVNGKWGLSFSPVTKAADKSGYRVTENISLVSRVAYAAVRLAWRQRSSPVSLPFKQMHSRIDGANDLVVLEFPPTGKKASSFGYFHPRRQFLSAHGNTFDADSVARQFKDIQKVAVRYSALHPDCRSPSNNFRCLTTCHKRSRMCTEELCGLMNCFPSLREIYIILEPPRKKEEQESVDAYIGNYCGLSPTSPFRSSLAIFHGSGQSYIEFNRPLSLKWDSNAGGAREFELEHSEHLFEMLWALKNDYLIPDADRSLSQDKKRAIGRTFRMSLAERQAVKCRVLIAAPVEKQVAWRGDVCDARALQEHLSRIPDVAWNGGVGSRDQGGDDSEDSDLD